jgi:hypothetical protein
MDEAQVKRLKQDALRSRRKTGPPPRVCPGCGRLTRLVGEGLCGPCLRRLNAGPVVRHPQEAQPVVALPGGGRKRRGRAIAGDSPTMQVRVLAHLPLPNPPRPKHLTDEDRQHRVSVFALQVEEMLAAGVQRPINYSDPRLCPPDAGLSKSTVPHDAEEHDDD